MICVTGIGIVSALGIGMDANRSALRDLRSGIAPVRLLDTVHNNLPVGEVQASDSELRTMLGLPENQPANRTMLLGKLALREALRSAWVNDSVPTAFLNGTTVGGMDRSEQIISRILEGGKAGPDAALHDCGATTDAIADGEAKWEVVTTLSTACSSAANAMIVGAEMIRSGRVERVVAGGAECLSKFHINGFNALMILDHERCRPFADDRAGLNLGEGAAYLVLESEKTARARGALILAYLSGWENACDAYHQTATSPEGTGAYLAMTGALRTAGLQPSEISYVNAHGTGTPNNDATELNALHRVFGPELPPFASTKWLTGHTTSASGSIEAVFCIMGLNDQFMPGLSLKPSQPLRHILCNSFGFGGNDAAVILSAPAAAKEPVASSDETERVIIIENAAQISCRGLEDDDFPFFPIPLSKTRIHSKDPDFRKWLPAGDSRRLGRVLKRALVTSLKVLRDTGVAVPDAIITGTGLGSVEDTEQCLLSMLENGETAVSPTRFMQSTHNTFSSLIAIATGAHGYNATYSHRRLSFESALADACLRLRNGLASNVLVGANDGLTDTYYKFLCSTGQLGLPGQLNASETSAAFLLRTVTPEEGEGKVVLLGHRLFHRPTLDELQTAVCDMVLEQGVPFEVIKAVYIGADCSENDDRYYRQVFVDLFQEMMPLPYSLFCGVNYTNSALAFFSAFQELEESPKQGGMILFNNSREGASLTLIGKHCYL